VVNEEARLHLIVDAEIVGGVDGAELDLSGSDDGKEPRFELGGPPRAAPDG
jgi:hypothetical protein